MDSNTLVFLVLMVGVVVLVVGVIHANSLSPEERTRLAKEVIRESKRRKPKPLFWGRKYSIKERLNLDPDHPQAIDRSKRFHKRYRKYL